MPDHLQLVRLTDWQPRLISYLAECGRRPFHWGQHDCALFAAGAIEAMTGVDLAAPYRGHYDTALSGARRMREIGCRDHFELLDTLLPGRAVSFAQPGDVAKVEAEQALGVVQGAQIYVLRQISSGETELGLVPLTSASRAWRV